MRYQLVVIYVVICFKAVTCFSYHGNKVIRATDDEDCPQSNPKCCALLDTYDKGLVSICEDKLMTCFAEGKQKSKSKTIEHFMKNSQGYEARDESSGVDSELDTAYCTFACLFRELKLVNSEGWIDAKKALSFVKSWKKNSLRNILESNNEECVEYANKMAKDMAQRYPIFRKCHASGALYDMCTTTKISTKCPEKHKSKSELCEDYFEKMEKCAEGMKES